MSRYVINSAYIDGKWVSTDDTFEVRNPFSDEVIGHSADCNESLARSSVAAAAVAFETWKNFTAKHRAHVLKKWAGLISDEKETLGELITLENGKPLAQAIGEVTYAASFVEWYAEEGKRVYGLTIPTPHSSKRMMTLKQPVGVATLITPWNFPLAMVTRKASAALASGCTVVVKPSEETPFSALALASLGEKAGIPAGVFNVIPTSRPNVAEVGKVLCTHPAAAAVSFTGSTSTGKIVMKQAADTVKKVSLELGGLAPVIVFDSADLKTAVKGTLASKFRNSGQSCICANRVLVQSGIYDRFVEALQKAVVEELVLGDGMKSETTIGPLINEAALKKVEDHLEDAVSQGAKLLVGGSRGKFGKNTFQPTLITDATPSMKCFKEETFGPLLPICKFDAEEEALDIANDASVGLAAYVFSGDASQCWRVSEKIQTGIVGINEGLVSCPETPHGGVKQSGLGREGSLYGMDEFTEVKYLCWGV